MSDSIAAQLEPNHIPTDEDLKEEANASLAPEDASKEDPDNPLGEIEYTFDLDYKDARGKTWRGAFTDKILTLGNRQAVEIVRARYHGGLSMESFSQEAVERNLMLAHLNYSIVKRPKWAEDLRGLYDPGIVSAIFAHAAEHEDFFLGWGPAATSGKAGG